MLTDAANTSTRLFPDFLLSVSLSDCTLEFSGELLKLCYEGIPQTNEIISPRDRTQAARVLVFFFLFSFVLGCSQLTML